MQIVLDLKRGKRGILFFYSLLNAEQRKSSELYIVLNNVNNRCLCCTWPSLLLEVNLVEMIGLGVKEPWYLLVFFL